MSSFWWDWYFIAPTFLFWELKTASGTASPFSCYRPSKHEMWCVPHWLASNYPQCLRVCAVWNWAAKPNCSLSFSLTNFDKVTSAFSHPHAQLHCQSVPAILYDLWHCCCNFAVLWVGGNVFFYYSHESHSKEALTSATFPPPFSLIKLCPPDTEKKRNDGLYNQLVWYFFYGTVRSEFRWTIRVVKPRPRGTSLMETLYQWSNAGLLWTASKSMLLTTVYWSSVRVFIMERRNLTSWHTYRCARADRPEAWRVVKFGDRSSLF